MSTRTSTHEHHLEQLGIADRSLAFDAAAPKRRKPSSPGRPSQIIGIFSESDLLKLRGLIFWRFADDERREGRTVVVTRGLRPVARIECVTEALAWDVERICVGIRFKRGAA